jgi:hypothetical protein
VLLGSLSKKNTVLRITYENLPQSSFTLSASLLLNNQCGALQRRSLSDCARLINRVWEMGIRSARHLVDSTATARMRSKGRPVCTEEQEIPGSLLAPTLRAFTHRPPTRSGRPPKAASLRGLNLEACVNRLSHSICPMSNFIKLRHKYYLFITGNKSSMP